MKVLGASGLEHYCLIVGSTFVLKLKLLFIFAHPMQRA